MRIRQEIILGNVSVVCTDKSGTLTQNHMTVRDLRLVDGAFTVSGVGYEPSGKIDPAPGQDTGPEACQALLAAASLCNNSRLVPPSAEHPL